MDTKKIQKLIDDFYYWDYPVDRLDCNYFADEVELSYTDDEDNKDVVYHFKGCYKVIFDHIKGYAKIKPVKEMTRGQISCFLQDVEVSITTEDDIDFYICKINMFPMNVEIWCKDIEVFKRDKFDKEK